MPVNHEWDHSDIWSILLHYKHLQRYLQIPRLLSCWSALLRGYNHSYGRRIEFPTGPHPRAARFPKTGDGALDDFAGERGGKITLGDGEFTKTIAIEVKSDTNHEPDENFWASVYGLDNATHDSSKWAAKGVIQDDDR
ncbi:MAG: hypothetical protein ACYS74_11085 [Planctomycetota bacterium]